MTQQINPQQQSRPTVYAYQGFPQNQQILRPQNQQYFIPKFYFIYDPAKFSDTNNPWNASMWLKNIYSQIPKPSHSQQVASSQAQFQTQQTQIKPQPSPIASSQSQLQNQQTIPLKPPASSNIASSQSQIQTTNTPQKDHLFGFSSVDQFQQLRHHATEESALQQLNELGTCLNKVDPNTFTPEPISLFIICNSYTNPKYILGVGPINDAITVAANHKFMGYSIYFLHNTTPSIFLKFLKVFLQKVGQFLSIFYCGHGGQVKDRNGDEDDGYDEAIVFDSGYIVDDELANYLKKYHNGKARTTLISDCCHSGTIWDIPSDPKKAALFPPNILSIASAEDSQTAKQTNYESKSQGVFTYNFWTILRNNPTMTTQQMKVIMDRLMSKFQQQFIALPTRPELLTSPIFPLMSKF